MALHKVLPIKTLDFGELYQEDFPGKKKIKMTDLAAWSKRKTGIDPLHGSAHQQENSYQYLEGLGDKEDI